MGASAPKQYHRIAGRPVLIWSVDAMHALPEIAGVVVVRASDDAHFHTVMPDRGPRLRDCAGGADRAASVQAGLAALRDWGAGADDRVLVHDAARPAVQPAEIRRLIEAVGDDPDGGLLAAPVRDTLKRADAAGRALETPPRDGLWQAMTPQCFPLARLEAALATAVEGPVTDEAQAMEHLGARPRLVASDPGNIKYTYPEDADWLAWILTRRQSETTR